MIDQLVSSGLVPDFLLKKGIRQLIRQREVEIKEKSVEDYQQRIDDYVKSLKQSSIALEVDKANEQHYEVPAAFYQLVLGERLKYSCGYWSKDMKVSSENLNQAEKLMLERTCQFAKLNEGQKILELGCGWGSLTLTMAEKYPLAQITAVSNSSSQKKYILDQAKKRGIHNIQVCTCDMNEFSIDEKFDRIVSVEMFEHMRNYQELLKRINGWLKDDGLLFIHIFVHYKTPYLFEIKDKTDWMSRYFFSGGQMPSDHLLYYFNDHMKVIDHYRYSGEHYQKTALAWLKNMDDHEKQVQEIFQECYGQQWKKWVQYWRVFFLACAELWGYQGGRPWHVSHYLLGKNS